MNLFSIQFFLCFLVLEFNIAKCKLWGYPEMLNCPLKKDLHNFTVKDDIVITAKWSNYRENKNNPGIIQKYNWKYKLFKYYEKNGKIVKEPIDITPFLNQNAVALKPYSLPPYDYMVFPIATPKDPSEELRLPVNKVCYITYKAFNPSAIISGGSQRTVSNNIDIKISGEESYDPNEKIKNIKSLKFTWECKQKIEPQTFCLKTPLSTDSSFAIPTKFLEAGDQFNITLTVETPYKTKASVNQLIDVSGIAADLEISCEKNCVPVSDFSNYQQDTFLKVNCKSNCMDLTEKHFEWSIKNVQFDFNKNTQFGKNSKKLFIFKNSLTPGEYTINIVLTKAAPRLGRAYFILNFKPPPEIKSCSLKPQSGQSMVTDFTFSCQQAENDRFLYELSVRDKTDSVMERVLVHDFYPNAFDVEFMLPPSKSFIYLLRVYLYGGPPKEIQLTGNVKEKKMEASDLNKFYSGEGDPSLSISNLLRSIDSNDKEKGIRKLNNLIDQLVGSEKADEATNKFVDDLKYDAVVDMLNTHLTTVDEVSSVSQAVTKLMSYKEPKKTDPLLAKFSSTVCKKMMSKHMGLIQKEKFPLNFREKSGKVTKVLNQCLESNTNPNLDAIAPIKSVTEPVIPSIEEIITEQYANYIDFSDKYYKNIENLEEATNNILNASSISAKILAMTTAPGEKFVEIFGKKSATIVAKDEGKILAKSRIRSQGVELIPPKDFRGDDHLYDILMSTWNSDILWWNRGKVQVATDIANIEFWHSTCRERIRNFKEGALLSFDLKTKVIEDRKFIKEQFIVPEGYESKSEEDLNRIIKVRRMLVAKNRILQIHFADLSNDEILDVTVTNFKFPTYEDFKNKKTVKSNKNLFIEFRNNESFAVWVYLGVLSNKQSIAKIINYNLSFESSYCIHWIELKSDWSQACQSVIGNNDSIIKCKCYNFSVLAGYLETVKSDLQEVILTDLELELKVNYLIFITFFITFGLYCFAIIFSVIKKKRNDIYFLSDNHRKDRFAYLLTIKTGGNRNSGTTSNVTIVLIGSKSSSDPHVLNYPDPKLKILQKYGKDLFILTTRHYLGDIEKIQLWFDCIGHSPDWFCVSITIFDMQQLSKWFFKIDKSLGLIKGHTFVELTPTKSTLFNKENKFTRYHTWWFWYQEENFGFVKKLTVILSNVLLIYVLVMVVLGVPVLQLRDGLDQEYQIDNFNVYVAFIISFVTFLIHIVIAWCFRFFKFDEKNKSTPTSSIIIWILLICFITISSSFLVIFGFWVPINKSLVWLTICALALTLNIFIYEPLFAFLANFLCKIETKYNINWKLQGVWKSIENQRLFLYKNFGEALLRPYFTHLYKPLETALIKEKEEFVKNRRSVVSELEDLAMFGVYIILIYGIIWTTKADFVVRSKIEIEKIINGEYTRTMSFYDLESIYSIDEYINSTLIASIQPTKWYGNYSISEPGLMVDMSNKYLGLTRFRQQRIKANACKIANEMDFTRKKCNPEFSILKAQTGIFGYGKQANIKYLKYDRLKDIWTYSSERKTGTFGTVGEFAVYSGGGYISYLGRTLHNSYANLNEIFGKLWIDEESRSVFIEFLTYNANKNIFISVMLLFEQSATGYNYKEIEVFAARMLYVQNELELFSTIFSLFFVIWVVILFLKQFIGTVKNLRNCYKDVWFLVDFIIIGMSFFVIGLNYYRMLMIQRYLNQLENSKKNDFLNYFSLFQVQIFLGVFSGILVCIATIRLWRFLRFGLMFRVFERTVYKSLVSFSTLAFIYTILILAFAQVIVLSYGNEYPEIHKILKTARLLASMILRVADLKLKRYTSYKSAYFYFPILSLLVKIAIAINVTVIVHSYYEAQLEFSSIPEKYNIKHYVQEQIKYIPKFLKYKYSRLKAGQDKLFVEPKSNKFILLNSFSISTNRMKNIEITTKCLFRNLKRPQTPKEQDFNLMLEVCKQYLLKSEDDSNEIFFKGRIHGNRIALIDENQVSKIARLVQELCQKKKSTIKITKTKNPQFLKTVAVIKQNQKILRVCSLNLKLIIIKFSDLEHKLRKL